MNAVAPLIPCIVSGGSGTRLWPVSRESMPKPFMRLADDQSLLQKTFLRIAGLPDVARLLTVTNRDLLFRTLDDYRAVNRSGLAQDLLLEPVGRNTAPAIAAAALHVQEHFGDQAQLLILPADHLIRDEQAFAAAVAEARELAAQGYLVTFGITPERAETGFGYIEQGAPLGNGFRVARFVEKPDQATAQSYLDSGKYLWNAGMFCFQAATVLQELERHAPEVLIAARAALADGSSLENGQCRQRELAAGAFAEAPDISVDYALMERSDKVAVVPCSIGWSDIGSWQALRELSAADENGNQVRGESVLLHSKQPVSAEDRQALEPFLERLVVLPRRPLRSLSTLLAALFAPYPLLASVNGLSAELQRTATELLREPWDVVQVEHSYSFQPYERPLRDAGQPFVLTEHNVESSLGAATYDRLPGWALPFVRYDQWRYRRWERRVMSQAAAVVAVTEKDARQLGAMLGRPVPVVVNGVDCEHFAAARPTPEAQRVLFLGNYEYAPNVDAVEWMLDEILPRVWAHCPEARMSVCGYALPAEWAQRWSDPRIEWQGFVPDLLQLQSSSSVFLAALRHGGGSKLKVLEALAAGLPLASTAQGVSGLELRDGEDYLGGESAEQLANAVVRLLQDPAQARALGENGRAYVRRAHDWSVAASQLEQVYAGLAEGAPACA
ncbi:TPA: glycosyltransferase [Pseudomonas aeruginosa]|nr:glycosyltransferase [Pseudomonas aeruginosa]HCG0533221.1 glycosyltransferase [Pseudomonas aeruginosa]HCG0539904.1 glycosyltransferase [Pseudomonas aeruginosa]HCG0545776.1 glycosyltransferase [Pseudomonas aeruginosa]HCG0550006.1 glycosyltransferase [Pseudomonas aeruginosa]